MARTVIPGIYMIRNKQNGKVYIGQSKDILKRFRYYYWGSTTTCNYKETTHKITMVIREEGFKNFEILILDGGEHMKLLKQRLKAEVEYIAAYHANDPTYGYNEDSGGDPGRHTARKQSFHERLRRAEPVFLYSIENQSVQLYMFGAKAIADDFGIDKAIPSHAMNRCLAFHWKYYIIPARKATRDKLLKKKLKKLNNSKNAPDAPIRVVSRMDNTIERIVSVYKYIDEIAPEFGFKN